MHQSSSNSNRSSSKALAPMCMLHVHSGSIFCNQLTVLLMPLLLHLSFHRKSLLSYCGECCSAKACLLQCVGVQQPYMG